MHKFIENIIGFSLKNHVFILFMTGVLFVAGIACYQNTPIDNSFISYADVAQLAEQLICNQQVIGSSPIIGFIQFNIELYYGQIPEWPKGTDCKSAATCFDGSNPSLPITLYRVTKYYRGMEQSGSSPGS